jgi:RimJ/RimL family protein N-acetyltransferase
VVPGSNPKVFTRLLRWTAALRPASCGIAAPAVRRRPSGAPVNYNDAVTPSGYPAELERELALRDGTVVRLRPIRPDDAPRLQALHGRLSRDSAYHRFFAIVKRLPPDWARVLATVDYRRRLALVVEDPTGGNSELIAVGRYDALEEADTVEVAFVVQDSWQNRGLGTLLFDAILRAAAAQSYRRFRAYVLADNRRMLDLITRFTLVESRKTEQSVTELVFSLVPGRTTAGT